MSIEDNKVIFDPKIKSNRSRAVILALTAIEVVLTVVLSSVIAITRLLNPSTEAAAGVPAHLSYQGRLTDTGGNALGGSGTNYCMRFSIYDASSSGNKVWPAGTPVSSTISVVSGVFNADIGSADALTYNFYDTSTVFLNVEVSNSTSSCITANFETLTPRQQIMATGFAITAQNVYGNLLRTQIASNTVQIGTGAGVASTSAIYLGLDWVNVAQSIGATCSRNGQVWYNSNASNTQTLVCENGKIRAVVDRLVVTNWPIVVPLLNTSANDRGTTAAGTNITGSFYLSPLVLDHAVSFSRINIMITSNTIAGTGSGSINRNIGIYTLNGNTALSLLSSFMFRQEISQNSITAHSERFYWGTNSTSNSSSSGGNITANYTGPRVLPMFTGATSIPAGQYWVAYNQIEVSNGSNILSLNSGYYVSQLSITHGQLGSASTLPQFLLIGQFSSTTTAGNLTTPFMPSSINTSAITNTGGTAQWRWNYINFIGSQL